MSGAQGAHPIGETTQTTYESVEGGENRTRTALRSKEDQGAIQIEKEQDKVDDRFLKPKKENDKDATGVTGAGE